MKMKYWIAAILACGISFMTASGQQSTTPASKPADSGPSLAVTMQLLQSKLNEQGKLSWTTHYHDSADNTNWIYQFTVEAGKVVADAAACTDERRRLDTSSGPGAERGSTGGRLMTAAYEPPGADTCADGDQHQ